VRLPISPLRNPVQAASVYIGDNDERQVMKNLAEARRETQHGSVRRQFVIRPCPLLPRRLFGRPHTLLATA
jgi:hypothetical protein